MDTLGSNKVAFTLWTRRKSVYFISSSVVSNCALLSMQQVFLMSPIVSSKIHT